ncbi:MAG TPA: S9 family peptidase, partial [Thermoanaerobaculia bacterium]|nr:S9 family peptidase [Thermoanaerobaculia bacterium]
MPFISSAQRKLAVLGIALALLAGASPSFAAEKRLITETDIFNFVWIADPQISPDGKKIAFVRVTVDEKKEGYDTALWIVPTTGSEPARPLTSGTGDSSPRWSPDGSRLVFVRAGEKDGQPQPGQLYLLSMQGGEARRLTDVPRGAGSPAWSPDGRSIAFTSTANPKDLEKKAARGKTAGRPGAAAEEERESDVRVITRAIYRMNGPGYLDP